MLERLTDEEALAQELDEIAARVGHLRERHPRVGGTRVELCLAEARAALLAVVGELHPRTVTKTG